MVMSVSQGACLGQQDVWTPLSVLVATGLLNAGAALPAAAWPASLLWLEQQLGAGLPSVPLQPCTLA